MMPGDTVTLRDGRNNDNHNTGWVDYYMDALIGKSFVIREVRTNPSCPPYHEYKLDGDVGDYWYDEAWLSLVVEQSTAAALSSELGKFLDLW